MGYRLEQYHLSIAKLVVTLRVSVHTNRLHRLEFDSRTRESRSSYLESHDTLFLIFNPT